MSIMAAYLRAQQAAAAEPPELSQQSQTRPPVYVASNNQQCMEAHDREAHAAADGWCPRCQIHRSRKPDSVGAFAPLCPVCESDDDREAEAVRQATFLEETA